MHVKKHEEHGVHVRARTSNTNPVRALTFLLVLLWSNTNPVRALTFLLVRALTFLLVRALTCTSHRRWLCTEGEKCTPCFACKITGVSIARTYPEPCTSRARSARECSHGVSIAPKEHKQEGKSKQGLVLLVLTPSPYKSLICTARG